MARYLEFVDVEPRFVILGRNAGKALAPDILRFG